MNDFTFPKRAKKSIDDLNVVPILDMFVSIVFFLLLSASMVGMTKLVVPPSATSVIESGSTKVPINAKLNVIPLDSKMEAIKIVFKWEGAKPGELSLSLKEDIFVNQKVVVGKIKEMVQKFKNQYPGERTVQISMQTMIPYQWLITVMDGVTELLPDVVLNSYTVADAEKE